MTPIAVQQLRNDGIVGQETPNLFNTDVNIRLGQYYFAYCVRRTKTIKEALFCYNGGWRQVRRHREGKVVAKESRDYYQKVILYYELSQTYQDSLGYILFGNICSIWDQTSVNCMILK